MTAPRIDNHTVRHAVGAFAADPCQRRSLDVLRACMYGSLLFDITGSDMPQPGERFIPEGGVLQIRQGRGPDGRDALFAFTGSEQIARLYPPDTRTQGLGQTAISVLEYARNNDYAWLYIDPAGPTCALSAHEIDFALRNPHNEPVKTAIAELHDGRADRQDVRGTVLSSEGQLLLGADETTRPGQILPRSITMGDRSTALAAFTSAAEVIAYNLTDAVAAFNTAEVVDKVRAGGFSGLVINPAGPSIGLSAAEIR